MNYFKIPFLNPFKFVPSTKTPGIHFDDRWACEQIRSWEMNVRYRQKWNKADVTKLQCESSLVPDVLKIYNVYNLAAPAKTIAWIAMADVSAGAKVYELLFDISDLPDGIYALYVRATFGPFDKAAVSEPIHSKVSWPDTSLFNYKNSYNDHDVAFTTGISFNFRCEAAVMDMDPRRENVSFISQTRNSKLISSTPFREWHLWIASAPGVAPYITDIINRIFGCDYVLIDNKQFTAKEGVDGTIGRQKGYPLVGFIMDILESDNAESLEMSDVSVLAPGLVTTYNIETGFFGPGSVVPVTEVLENG